MGPWALLGTLAAIPIGGAIVVDAGKPGTELGTVLKICVEDK